MLTLIPDPNHVNNHANHVKNHANYVKNHANYVENHANHVKKDILQLKTEEIGNFFFSIVLTFLYNDKIPIQLAFSRMG